MHILPLIAGMLVLTAVSTVFAEPVTISGRVAYQEVVRLPDGAAATIRMLDGSGTTVAEASVEDPGPPPIPFELLYDAGEISTGATYVLEAEIALEDRTLFRSPKPQPLKSPATSQQVSLIVRLVRD
ncbi:MAG: YbaY family lipoprotein [Geminicoccaceae bacterium]|nr:YbaY family lipoprotein [Geminicoccaceae bacterium]